MTKKISWDKFQVALGNVWKAGPHTFLCGDLETNDKERFIEILNKPVSLVYTDSPWSAGNAKYWRTHAGMSRQVDIENLWGCLCDVIQRSGAKEVFIEQGVKHWRDFVSIAIKYKIPPLSKKWVVYYNNPARPNILIRFAETERQGFDPTGLKNEPMTDYVFQHIAQPGGVVIDPCIGKGMTARMAHRYGMVCYGMELNPKRLAATLDWLSKYYEVKLHENI